jgi:NodT family efflux transporter outer membrane factor (OMF) lipoprotein
MRVALFALALGGCATAVPDRAPPSLPAGHQVPLVRESGPALADRLAGDPAFQPLLAAALAGSPDLETAAARVRQARVGLALARANGRPSLDASLSASRARSSLDQAGFDLPGAGIERDRTSLSVGVEAGWELDLFGRLRAGRAAARARLDAATADAAGTRLSLETDIARQLIAIRALDARRGSAMAALASARDLDRLARVRAEAGLATGLDPATTAADVAGAEAALAPLAAARVQRLTALSRLTGLPADQVSALVAGPVALPAPSLWAIPPVPSDLLRRRPDIAAALADLQAADQDVASALAARYPRLTLTGSLGWLSGALATLLTGDTMTASLGGGLAGPLLDFGRTAATVERQRGVAAEAAGRYRGAVLSALAEVESALADAREARAEAAARARAAEALDIARRLAEVQYRGGLTDARTVSEAARRLADSRDRQLAAEADAIDAALRLALATGDGLAPGGRQEEGAAVG